MGEASIRLQFNQDEQWTKALKYMLTNLKWILAFVCKQHQQQDAISIAATSTSTSTSTSTAKAK